MSREREWPASRHTPNGATEAYSSVVGDPEQSKILLVFVVVTTKLLTHFICSSASPPYSYSVTLPSLGSDVTRVLLLPNLR